MVFYEHFFLIFLWAALEQVSYYSSCLFFSLCISVFCKLDFMPEMYIRMDDFLYKPVTFRTYLNKIGTTSFEGVKEIHSQKGIVHPVSIKCSLPLSEIRVLCTTEVPSFIGIRAGRPLLMVFN